jgi:hypothetical protein
MIGSNTVTKVQCLMDDEFMMVNIPDDRETYALTETG